LRTIKGELNHFRAYTPLPEAVFDQRQELYRKFEQRTGDCDQFKSACDAVFEEVYRMMALLGPFFERQLGQTFSHDFIHEFVNKIAVNVISDSKARFAMHRDPMSFFIAAIFASHCFEGYEYTGGALYLPEFGMAVRYGLSDLVLMDGR
jgi:hypothetical protein